MDVFSPEKRSAIMRSIRATGTKPEEMLRKTLFRLGLRYRKNSKTLPGRPDIVFAKHKVIVFVHGCFWHHHSGCKYAATPKSNQAYWLPKLTRNLERDTKVQEALRTLGWTILIVWECEIKADLMSVAERVMSLLREKRSKGSMQE